MQTNFTALRLLFAVLAAVCAADAGAETLGRLFTTPEQRAMLERLRHAPPAVEKPVAKVEPPPAEPPPAPLPPVPPITVNGLVVRSNGDSTAWVNGRNTLDGDLSAQYVKVEPGRIRGNTVQIITPEPLPEVRLKPGQTYDPATGRIVEVYQQPRTP